MSICIFQSSDATDECNGDISVAVTVVAVLCGVKCDVYEAFVCGFGVGLVPCCSYVVVDSSNMSSENKCL